MQLTLWTYEGPPHIGAMRIATATTSRKVTRSMGGCITADRTAAWPGTTPIWQVGQTAAEKTSCYRAHAIMT